MMKKVSDLFMDKNNIQINVGKHDSSTQITSIPKPELTLKGISGGDSLTKLTKPPFGVTNPTVLVVIICPKIHGSYGRPKTLGKEVSPQNSFPSKRSSGAPFFHVLSWTCS